MLTFAALSLLIFRFRPIKTALSASVNIIGLGLYSNALLAYFLV